MIEYDPQVVSVFPLPVPGSLNFGIVGNDREQRSLHIFRHEVGKELFNSLKLTLLHQLILQASHSEAAIRSAAIALGSFGERIRINSVLTWENDEANRYHHYARRQYVHALVHTRRHIETEPEGSETLAILSCFLLCVFEFLQGNGAGFLIHLRSGLDILRGSAGVQAEEASPDVNLLRYEMMRLFCILDNQATLWLGLETFQSPLLVPLKGLTSMPPREDRFSTLEEAVSALDYLIGQHCYLQRYIDEAVRLANPDDLKSSVMAPGHALLARLDGWNDSMNEFRAELSCEQDTELLQYIAVMRMSHKATRIQLIACLNANQEFVYHASEAEFCDIVYLASLVPRPFESTIERIASANNIRNDPSPFFFHFIGLIRPLYFTAVKCQNQIIAREAVSILSTSPWREGAWDSAAMADMAQSRVDHSKRFSDNATITPPATLGN